MKVIGFVLMATLSLWGQNAADAGAHSKLVAFEHAWNRAAQTKDTKAVDSILDSAFVYIDFDGKIMTKAQVLADVKAANVEDVISEGMNAHIDGNTGIVTGIYRMKGFERGKAFVRRGRFMDIWVFKGGLWICVASQVTPILH